MNLPANAKLSPAPRASAAKHLASMFAVMQCPTGGKFTKAVAAQYLDAVAEIPEWIIKKIATEFIDGRRGDGKWAPHPGEFAQVCRAIRFNTQKQIEARRHEQAEVKTRIQRRALLEERTPEQKARVQYAADRVKKACAQTLLERSQIDGNKQGRDLYPQDPRAREATIKALADRDNRTAMGLD